MNPDQKAKLYVAALKKMLSKKQQGYKTFGALTGGALGSGIGGTVGLVKTINKHREGEMDDLDNIDKIKEYLKSMGGHAAAGLGAGALLGTGAGAAAKKMSVNKISKPGVDYIKSVAADPMANKYVEDAGRGIIRQAKEDVPSFNMMDATKEKLKNMFSKTASAVPGTVPTGGPFNNVVGLKRNAARFYGTRGGLIGTGVGAVGGALKGLVSPDEEVDPTTGKKVEQGRLYSALTGGLKGGLVGGGIGAGVGAAGGAMRGAKLHPHFVAGANALHKANPDHLGHAAAVAGKVHIPYESFAMNEGMRLKQYLDDLKARMSTPPTTA